MAAPFSLRSVSIVELEGALPKSLLYSGERHAHGVDNAVARMPAESLAEYLGQVGILVPNRPEPIALSSTVLSRPNRK